MKSSYRISLQRHGLDVKREVVLRNSRLEGRFNSVNTYLIIASLFLLMRAAGLTLSSHSKTIFAEDQSIDSS